MIGRRKPPSEEGKLAASTKDIAEKAGVSVATVSHVLNGTRGTRPHTRQKVLAAAADLGYAPNQAARNPVLGRSTLLGLVISDIRNPFFSEVSAAFQDQAVLHDRDAIVVNTNYDAYRTLNSVRRLIDLQVPAVAVLTSQVDAGVMDILAERGIAAVYLDLGRVDRLVSTILVDYEHGISEALEHLRALGHERIAYIGGPGHLHSAQRRKRGFIASAARFGVDPSHTVDADFTVKGGYFACSKLLNGYHPTAIVAANDLTAIGVLHRAYDGGIRVPGELSVVGFDDIQIAEYSQPALTTVAVPSTEIGKMAFQALWTMLRAPGTAGTEVRVPTQLVTRQSTIAPAACAATQ